MNQALWLPAGTELAADLQVQSLLHADQDWQIVETPDASRALLAHPALADRWLTQGFLEPSLCATFTGAAEPIAYLASRQPYALKPVARPRAMLDKVEATAFAAALRETRKISQDAPLHDAIYVEQYTRLLPTWSAAPPLSDDVVLGMWLTGGAGVSVLSFPRLCELAVWLMPEQLAQIIAAAGFSPPAASRPSTPVRRRSAASPSPATDVPKVQGAFSLPGRPELESFFNDHVVDIIVNAAQYQALGIHFPAPFVLHGPPGCGKTYAVEQLVAFLGLPHFAIDSSTIGSEYIHGTSRRIAEVFEQAMDVAPAVIVIDEMESCLANRQMGGKSGLFHIEEMAEFLRRIPEAVENQVLLIGMTNMLHLIDPAILRRGRFDHVIEVSMPSSTDIAALLDSLLAEIPTSDDLDLQPVVTQLAGKPLSDAAFVVREAARLAAKAAKPALDQASLAAALHSF